MEIILLERIEKLGQMGDVVSVKDGYARNFLLPKNKALRATAANKAYFESQRKEFETRNLEAKNAAEKDAKGMEGTTVVLLRQAGDSDQLYGSVTTRDIAAELRDAGFKVRRSQIVLDRPIKEIGIHDVLVRVHPEVSVTVHVNTARTTEEAKRQVEAKEAPAVEDVFETEELAHAAEEALAEAPAKETEEEAAAASEATEEAGAEDSEKPDAGAEEDEGDSKS